MTAMKRFLAALTAILLSLPSGYAVAADSASLRATIEQFLSAQTKGLPGKVETQIGALDPRLQLADCPTQEAFLPPGGRLWGKTTIGVRCLASATWTVYIPVRIGVRGEYVVTARALTAGQSVTESDLATRQGDLTALPAGVLTSPAQAIGKTMKNSLGGGQALRADQLLSPPAVLQGQDVRLIYRGDGFAVTNEGKALNSAADGQVARARTAGGQTVSGIARSGGIIEVSP